METEAMYRGRDVASMMPQVPDHVSSIDGVIGLCGIRQSLPVGAIRDDLASELIDFRIDTTSNMLKEVLTLANVHRSPGYAGRYRQYLHTLLGGI
jgi:hypothetical protein